MKSSLSASLSVTAGSPLIFGAKRTEKTSNTINFALYSGCSRFTNLKLYHPNETAPFATISLDPKIHRTGQVWHVAVSGLLSNFDYSFTFDASNQEIIDPYARTLTAPRIWGDSGRFWRAAYRDIDFDWEGVSSPRYHPKDLIIYEMHVRGFTIDPSSGVKHPGSYLGVIEKIPYLVDLGVNAIELLPVYEFNELEYHPSDTLFQYWGYSPLHFFAPMGRYAVGTDAKDAVIEFRKMVRELHRAGIEVILDVVYNHSGEKDPNLFCSLRGIDNAAYFILDDKGSDTNYTGCGNTLSANHPMMTHLILESLRYWHLEMGVDGFRFDLASTLRRDPKGVPLSFSPVLETITSDPLLSDAKLIAEPWDPGGLYEPGHFAGTNKRWSEWNGRYRDSVRRFIRGDPGMAGGFATALCGSSDLYSSSEEPWHSVNFITAHDGFSLADLVSYNEKHNLANKEDNRDGSNHNESWNCGEEGISKNLAIRHLRERQRLNFLLALFLSQGIPMLRMGDEYGHSQQGNNNTWCQDSSINWFNWTSSKRKNAFYDHVQQFIRFRKEHSSFQLEQFFDAQVIDWHDQKPHEPDWEHNSRIVAFSLSENDSSAPIYVAFSAHHYPVEITLPFDPTKESWHQIVDTAILGVRTIATFAEGPVLKQKIIQLAPYSAIFLQKKREDPPSILSN